MVERERDNLFTIRDDAETVADRQKKLKAVAKKKEEKAQRAAQRVQADEDVRSRTQFCLVTVANIFIQS